MKTKHTPGPWDDINLCDLLDKSPEEIEANLALMNAAPEMLEALKECIEKLSEIRTIELEGKVSEPLYLTRATAKGKLAIQKATP